MIKIKPCSFLGLNFDSFKYKVSLKKKYSKILVHLKVPKNYFQTKFHFS
jgi:hypothetical protein